MNNQITFEDWEKLDLRVGIVKEAEKIMGSKNLLKLKVDVGEEKERTLVAGLANYYKPEEIIGERIIVLVNLEPRQFKGVLSEGMLLAASDPAKPLLITVKGEALAGARIR